MESYRARRNAFTWESAKKAWIENWVADTTAKETIMYDWISNKKYAKPAEENIPDHRAIISMICNYIDMLPGNRGLLTSNEKKNLFYNSFPESWKTNYRPNGRNTEEDNISQIEYYMEQQKKKLISNTNPGSRSTIKRRKIKTKKLPSRRAKEEVEVTPYV